MLDGTPHKKDSSGSLEHRHLGQLDLERRRSELRVEHLKDLLTQRIMWILEWGTEPSGTKIVLDKYPGTLYVAMDSLERPDGTISSFPISLQIMIGNTVVETEPQPPCSFIKISHYVKVPILNQHHRDVVVRVLVREHESERTKCIFQGSMVVGKSDLTNLHNKLVEHKIVMKKKRSWTETVVGLVRKAQNQDPPICRCYFSYISAADLGDIRSSPNTLMSLCRWLIYRRMAFEQLFRGPINIKCGDPRPIWARRYVLWFGYTIFVFDIHKESLLHVVDLQDCEPSLELIQRKIISFRTSGSVCEIESEDREVLKKCTEATYKLFPQIIDWI